MKITIATLLAAGLLLGCGAKDVPESSTRTEAPPANSAPAEQPTEDAPEQIEEEPAGDPLLDPSLATATAPETYRVRVTTTEGDFVLQVNRAWSPNGADRFYNLVQVGFFDDIACFRVVEGFMCQFGIHGDPKVGQAWMPARIEDDPVVESNRRGTISFATAGPGTRTTQLFINKVDNAMLDGMGFSPFGRVVEGMDVVDKLHAGYGEGAPRGRGPDQGRIQREGNAYLKASFPELDYITGAEVLEE